MIRTPRRAIATHVASAFIALLTSGYAHADPEGPEAISDSVRFAELVTAGDNARRAHRNNEASKAYNAALDIRRDPAVEGRLGLLFLESGNLALAAENLLQAITKAQASPILMRQFHDAFARVRPKVCFVEVFVSEPDAEIFIDEELEEGAGVNAFHVFVTAGSHTFQAKLKGFQDATETIDVPAGGELSVRLSLKPLAPPPPPPPPPPLPPLEPPVPVKPHGSLSNSYLHFFLGAGPVLVLGAAPGVSVGPQINVGFRYKFFSLNADGRVAWATGTLEAAPDMRFVTWAAGLQPCGHYRFLFGCGVLQVSGMKSLAEEDRWQTRFGGGLRGGIELFVRTPLRLQLWGEVVALSKGYSLVKDNKGLWQGLPVLGGFGATAFLTW